MTTESTKRTNLSNVKATAEMIQNIHIDEKLNRQLCLENFAKRWIDGNFSQLGLDALIEFVTEAWQHYQDSKAGDFQSLLASAKTNPDLRAALLKELGVTPTKSAKPKAE